MNKTKQDAYERVVRARLGCLAGTPSIEYLQSLLRYIHEWADEIDREIFRGPYGGRDGEV